VSARHGAACAALLLAAVLVHRTEAQAPFRSNRTVVSVNVSVKDRNAPVPDLTAADFVLTDNGVAQTIEAVGMETFPIDLTVVLDTSGSTGSGIARLLAETEALAGRLRPSDRFRLLTIDTYVHEVVALQSAGRIAWPARIPFNGASAVHDALFAGLVTPVDVDRRHLLIALTDGIDTFSVLDATMVRDAAQRSDVLLHLVGVTFTPAQAPVPPNWLPRRSQDLDVLGDAARRTGGDLHEAGPLGPDAMRAVHAAMDDFRSSYVLRYSPGVTSAGWHKLEVKLKRRGTFTIRARQGYFG
jgi:hypothetical protein